MKRLFTIALLACCSLYVDARNRGPIQTEWNTNAICLESDFYKLSTYGGWYASPWFSVYFQTPQWWIYHCDKGWLYPESDNAEGVWMYWEQSGSWIWTREDVYPIAYDTSSEQWFNFCSE